MLSIVEFLEFSGNVFFFLVNVLAMCDSAMVYLLTQKIYIFFLASSYG